MLDIRFPPLLAATFVDRPHRFMVHANRRGATMRAACLDPGRLLVLVRQGRIWASAVRALANAILQRAIPVRL